MMINKSLITNLVSIFIIFIGYLYKDEHSFIFMTGVFALSGSVTNWIAVHMLFEKIPFLYGSGVIQDRFEDIKMGIKNLILKELFSITQINKFLLDNKEVASEKIIEKIDFDKVFLGLVEAIEGSQLGGMLSMVGGRKALEPLKEPFNKKLKIIIEDFINRNNSDDDGKTTSEALLVKIENILDDFYEQILSSKFNFRMLDIIDNHKLKGDLILLASATNSLIVSYIANKLSIKNFISSEVLFKNYVCTGKVRKPFALGCGKLKLVKYFMNKNNFNFVLMEKLK